MGISLSRWCRSGLRCIMIEGLMGSWRLRGGLVLLDGKMRLEAGETGLLGRGYW
jgi:hypothetical protein